MCSGSEAGSYLRLIDFVYDSTLGLRVRKKKKKKSLLSSQRKFGEITCKTSEEGTTSKILSTYTQVYWVVYDSGSVPDSSIFSPRETSPASINDVCLKAEARIWP